MITPDKTQNAIYALHGVLIKARSLANYVDKQQEVVAILSRAEVLTTLFGKDSDETDAFRKILAKIAESHDCKFVLERFDAKTPWTSI